MIARAEFHNFKSLGDVPIELGAFTVVVGPNGCGKTSLLQGLEILTGLRQPQPFEERTPFRRLGVLFDRAGGVGRLRTNGESGPIRLAAEEVASRIEVTADPASENPFRVE